MGTAVIGAPEFKARSGRTVKVGEDGSLSIDHKRGYLSPEVVMDVEEWAQAKRDTELGRWRWPENPDYVVMDAGLGFAKILHEPTMETSTWESQWRDTRSASDEAGVAYFEAHPERKPWERAEPGEVWLFRGEGAPEPQVFLKYRAGWMNASGVVIQKDPVLPYAGSRDETFIPRRIWPEDAS